MTPRRWGAWLAGLALLACRPTGPGAGAATAADSAEATGPLDAELAEGSRFFDAKAAGAELAAAGASDTPAGETVAGPNPDAAAQAPYLSLGKGAKGQFVSYDSPDSIAAKIAWAKQNGLGGVIIWELGGGWRPQAPVGKQDLLLQAVKAAAFP